MDTRSASLASNNLTEDLYLNVENWATYPEYTDIERAALEFAEKFAVDHLAIDDELVNRLRAELGDALTFELTMCVASWMGLGRVMQVLGAEASCPLRI